MKPVLLVCQNDALRERLALMNFDVVPVDNYESAQRELSERHFDFVICGRHLPTSFEAALKLDVLQFAHWKNAHYPHTQLLVLTDALAPQGRKVIGDDNYLPAPDSEKGYQRLGALLKKLQGPRKSALPTNTSELVLAKESGELESHHCEDEELRRDLLDFLTLKGKNLEEILGGGSWLGVSWSGECEVDLVRNDKGSLLAIGSGEKTVEWPEQIRQRVYRDFGRTLP